MKKKSFLLCGLALIAALGLQSCNAEETLYGENVETGKSTYTTKVLVTVKGDTIIKVEIAEGSTHYTQGSSKWDGTAWTEHEEEVLKSFEGKSVSEFLASETNEVYDNVAGATLTSNRLYLAVKDALTKE